MRRSQIPHDVFFGGDDGEEASEASAPRRSRPKKKKVQVSVYLSPTAARLLDTLRLELQYDHGLKGTKSDLVDYAVKRLESQLEAVSNAARDGSLGDD